MEKKVTEKGRGGGGGEEVKTCIVCVNLQVSFPSLWFDCSSPMYTTSVVNCQGLSRQQSDFVLREL